MKLELPVLLLACSLGLAATRAADAAAPVLVEGLPEKVYRAVGVMKLLRGVPVPLERVENLMQQIHRDGVVSEAESRLLAELARGKFSIIIASSPAQPGSRPLRTDVSGTITGAALARLTEKERSIEELYRDPTPAGWDRLIAALGASSARRAEARDLLIRDIEQAVRDSQGGAVPLAAYRKLLNDIQARLEAAKYGPARLNILRRWLYEAFLLHDLENPGVVRDFMYSWIAPKNDHGLTDGQAIAAARAAVEAALAERAARRGAAPAPAQP